MTSRRPKTSSMVSGENELIVVHTVGRMSDGLALWRLSSDIIHFLGEKHAKSSAVCSVGTFLLELEMPVRVIQSFFSYLDCRRPSCTHTHPLSSWTSYALPFEHRTKLIYSNRLTTVHNVSVAFWCDIFPHDIHYQTKVTLGWYGW